MHSISFFQAFQMMFDTWVSFVFFPVAAFLTFLVVKVVRESDTDSTSRMVMGVCTFAVLLLVACAALCTPAGISQTLSNPAAKILSVTEDEVKLSVVIGYGVVDEVRSEKVLGQEVEVIKIAHGQKCVLDRRMLTHLASIGYTIAGAPIAEAVKVASAK